MLDNTYINCNMKTNFGKKVVQTQKTRKEVYS